MDTCDGFNALFCPTSIIDALTTLGQKNINEIFPRSHKCEFRFNPNILLTEFHIHKNTYVRMAKRTYNNVQPTGLVFRECIIPFIWGLEVAANNPRFFQNYDHIRAGLFALMTSYSEDEQVQKVLSSVLQHFPPPLKKN